MPAATPRHLWQLVEPLHAVVYFAPETKEQALALGLDGKGMAYTAVRTAPLGRVSAAAATAVLFGFSPALVRGAVPAVWERTDPAAVLAARSAAVDRALGRLLGDGVRSPQLARAADLLTAAAQAADVAGRPLAAGNQDLPVPDAPHLALWQAATTLREHRGDGHVAALVTAGVGPCASHVLRVAAGAAPRELVQATRGWSDDAWAAAESALVERDLLTAGGTLTDAGRRLRESYEDATDRLAASPWEALGTAATEELAGLLLPLARAVVDGGGAPVDRGLGSPWPPRA